MMAIDKRLIAEQLQTGIASTGRRTFMAYLVSIPPSGIDTRYAKIQGAVHVVLFVELLFVVS